MTYKCCENRDGIGWAFRNLTRAHNSAHMAVFDDAGLREIGQPIMLPILNEKRLSGEKCTQKELAEILHISPSTLTISIKSLEKRGYVKKSCDEQDMRRNYIEITEDGIQVMEKCVKCLDRVDEAMFLGFSPEEKADAITILNRMSDNLEKLRRENCESEV